VPSQRRPLSGAQTGARAQKALRIGMLVIVSKTVSGFWVRRGFKSLPLRSTKRVSSRDPLRRSGLRSRGPFQSVRGSPLASVQVH
jgi:hypothetical protein